MGLRLINSGRVAKFISAAEVARTRTHIFVSGELAGRLAQNQSVPAARGARTFDIVEKLERALTLRQYENALSQINKGIGVSVGSYFFASRAAISARIQEIRRMGLKPSSGRRCFGSSPSAQPCAPGATSTGPLVDDR